MRLFVAVSVGPAVEQRAMQAIGRIKKIAKRGSFTRRENLHVTLEFLGDTWRLKDAKRAMEALHAEPFTLTFRNIGSFEGPDGDIFWLGVEPSAQLDLLHRQLKGELARLGFEVDRRPFRPHLTLGRQVILKKREFNRSLPPAQTVVKRVTLFKSDLSGSYPVYKPCYYKYLEGR